VGNPALTGTTGAGVVVFAENVGTTAGATGASREQLPVSTAIAAHPTTAANRTLPRVNAFRGVTLVVTGRQGQCSTQFMRCSPVSQRDRGRAGGTSAARMFELSQAASDSARFRPAVWAEGGCVEFDKA